MKLRLLRIVSILTKYKLNRIFKRGIFEMSKEDFKLTNKNDIALLNAVTTAHENFFNKLQSKIKINTKAKSFIFNTMGDYVWDMNTAICDNPDYQLGWYWDGDVQAYATQLLDAMNNAENIIINLYLLYNESKEDLDDVVPEYEGNSLDDYATPMSDVSMDYYSFLGSSVTDKPEYQEIMKLNNLGLKELNSILKECGFKPVSMFKAA